MQNIAHITRWWGKKIFLVGIKGDPPSNYCTMHEWPAFLDDLQSTVKSGNIQVDYRIISEIRIEISDLPAFVTMFANDNSFIIVAS